MTTLLLTGVKKTPPVLPTVLPQVERKLKKEEISQGQIRSRRQNVRL
jgi:hypothetical protein